MVVRTLSNSGQLIFPQLNEANRLLCLVLIMRSMNSDGLNTSSWYFHSSCTQNFSCQPSSNISAKQKEGHKYSGKMNYKWAGVDIYIERRVWGSISRLKLRMSARLSFNTSLCYECFAVTASWGENLRMWGSCVNKRVRKDNMSATVQVSQWAQPK